MRNKAGIGAILAAILVMAAAPASALTLGSAADFGALGLQGVNITVSSGGTLVEGNVGVGPDGSLTFSGGGTITGDIVLHDGTLGTYGGAASSLTVSGGSQCAGGPDCTPLFQDMNAVIADVFLAAQTAAGLAVDQTFGLIDNSTGTIVRTGSVTVITVTEGIDIDDTLTLSGQAGDLFIFNVLDGATINLSGGGEILLEGGIDASGVLWNVIGSTGDRLNFSGNSETVGTFLAPERAITVSGGEHWGAFVAGGELKLQSAPTVHQVALIPEPGTLSLVAFGTVGLALAGRRRARA